MLRICLPACGARHLHAAWSAADICRPLCLVVTNYISFVSVLYTKTHSFRCSSSSRKVFWTFREPCYAPFIVRRTRSRVLLRKPVGRRFKLSHNKKNSPSQKERRVFWQVAPKKISLLYMIFKAFGCNNTIIYRKTTNSRCPSFDILG